MLRYLASKENMAVLVSSHNLSELESFCNKIVIIKNGEIVESSTMEEAKKVDGNNIYVFELDNVKNIEKIITNKLEIIDGNNIKVFAEKEEIPEIIEKLVEKKVKIYKICEDEISLESAFLKKTGGNVIE